MLQGRTNKKGITLVALIVTIVILLILSTVTVMEVRETALFERAQKGAKEYRDAQISEQEKINNMTNNIDEWGVRTEVENDLNIGDYIIYNVEYTDTYFRDTTFTKENGWRVINPGHKYSDKTYEGVEIIPTGVPARLWYHYKEILTADSTRNSYPWLPTKQELADFKKSCSYVAKDGKNSGVIAAAGLKNHIDKVITLTGTNIDTDLTYKQGKGCRVKIINNGNEIKGEEELGKTLLIDGVGVELKYPSLEIIKETMNKKPGGREFIIGTDSDIIGNDKDRIITEDDAANGFWNLADLDIGGYRNKGGLWVWIASPSSEDGNGLRIICSVGEYSAFAHASCGYGLRPIVKLKDGIKIDKSPFQGN